MKQGTITVRHREIASVSVLGPLVGVRSAIMDFGRYLAVPSATMIPAVAAASDDVRPGVISMAHCWGDSPSADPDGRVREIGSNTNRLIDNLDHAEKYSGIPRQSTVPVAVSKLD